MYIPVEGVYYELACGKTGALLAYAHERRVFPVSPTTFTAYLQVIALGLRGMKIEEHAHEVMAYVADLTPRLRPLRRRLRDRRHAPRPCAVEVPVADKRLDKFAGKLERASEDADVEEIEADVDDPPYAIEAA